MDRGLPRAGAGAPAPVAPPGAARPRRLRGGPGLAQRAAGARHAPVDAGRRGPGAGGRPAGGEERWTDAGGHASGAGGGALHDGAWWGVRDRAGIADTWNELV